MDKDVILMLVFFAMCYFLFKPKKNAERNLNHIKKDGKK